jgi:hypothetical protein
MQLATGYMAPACLYATAKLSIADFISTGPKTASEMAHASGVNESALYRILRALASIGVFRETAPRTFANTPASELLRKDVPGSQRDTILFLSDPLHFRVFGELMHSVETGGTAFTKVTGLTSSEFFAQNSDENHAFNAAMTSISANFVRSVLEGYDFGNSGTLADIGGGHGMTLMMILQKHRGLRGIVFDLPHVVAGAKSTITGAGLESRCDIAGGDFFQSVPPADGYVMKSIIHDWDDEHAIKILKNCAAAMRAKDGKIILIELVINPGNHPELGKWIDLEMLAIASGRERTESEYAELFGKAGLRLLRVVRTPAPASVVEAVKA